MTGYTGAVNALPGSHSLAADGSPDAFGGMAVAGGHEAVAEGADLGVVESSCGGTNEGGYFGGGADYGARGHFLVGVVEATPVVVVF